MPALTFDDALAELQRVVAELEAGGAPLEAADRPVRARRRPPARCEQLLGEAELRVQQLVARPDGALAARGRQAGRARVRVGERCRPTATLWPSGAIVRRAESK